MKRNIISVIVILITIQFTYAQVNREGTPIIHSYNTMITGGHEQNYSIMKDNRGIMYFGNETKGIIEYDGVNWRSIQVSNNPRILALEKDPEGTIYVSGPYEFGYLKSGLSGNLEYVSLIPKVDSIVLEKMGEVFDIQYFNGEIYFCSKNRLFIYNKATDDLKEIYHGDNFFTAVRVFSVHDKLIVADNRSGLVELSGDTLGFLPGGEKFARIISLAILEYDSTRVLVGTYHYGIILYDIISGEVDYDFVNTEINEQLKIEHVYNGVKLPDGNFAFGTTGGGVYIFDHSGDLVEKYSNVTSPLEDDQIYAIYLDTVNGSNNLLWINSYGYINRVAYNIPYRIYGEENNLTYALNDLCEFNGTLYVSGDKGILKRTYQDEKVYFTEVEGINDQTFSLLPFKADGRELLLAGTIDGLYIINEKDECRQFADLLHNKSSDFSSSNIKTIYKSDYHDGIFFLGLSRDIRIIRYKNRKWSIVNDVNDNIIGSVRSIIEESENKLWFVTGSPKRLYTLQMNETDTVVSEYAGRELADIQINSVSKIADKIVIATNSGIYKYNHTAGLFEPDSQLNNESFKDLNYYNVWPLYNNYNFVSSVDYQNFDFIVKPDSSDIVTPLLILPKTTTFDLLCKDDKLLLPKSKEIYIFDCETLDNYVDQNDVLIRKVLISRDSVIFWGTFFVINEDGNYIPVKHQTSGQIPRISHSYNDISIQWSSNNLVVEDSTVYSYMIEGFDDDWSKWEKVYYKDYTNLPHGKYKFKIKARTIARVISEETTYEFEVLRPWYLSVLAIIGYFILIVLSIWLIIKIYTRRLINENIRLEGIVAERTAEVVMQKEELEDSIHYASRIQRAILPSEKSLDGKVEDYFILFKPRDIVSGDFYWVSQKGPRLFIVAADCTGHGVPGAFMSILGISFLDEIINKSDTIATDKVLNELRSHVTSSLKQMEKGGEETKDGMDMGLLVINYNEDSIEYSGAYNPCWKVRPMTDNEKKRYLDGTLEIDRSDLANGEYILETINADRMPIGISSHMDKSFSMHSHKLEKGANYYMSSDGYFDQFGGEAGRKFLKKNLKKLILDIQSVPMEEQKELLDKKLIDWMGELEQIDDILVIGVRAI
ncbi:MAG: SpoIIE family protein phosphatase [Bacteroidales bacterium]|nr:SpoIIE family protein phosphatase [Bacteroidales bacterium]